LAILRKALLRINGKEIGELKNLDIDRMTAHATLFRMPDNAEWGPIVLEPGMDIVTPRGRVVITYEQQMARPRRFKL
jgi:sporulation protein YlmC with PRC-barrel domain